MVEYLILSYKYEQNTTKTRSTGARSVNQAHGKKNNKLKIYVRASLVKKHQKE